MKKLHKTTESTAPQGYQSEISQKKAVNTPKNSSLYFQIGLILCLLATYGLLEMNFRTVELPTVTYDDPFKAEDPFHLNEIVVVPNAVKPKPRSKPIALLTDKAPIVKPNTDVIPDPVTLDTPESLPVVEVPGPVVPNTVPQVPTTPVVKEWNVMTVEKVPVFPGCESATNNAERLACMSEKLAKLIQRKFNTGLAADLGLSGTQRIYVQFKIDDEGQVTEIKSRSPYSQLDREAERVVNSFPTMIPGMQHNTPVSVIYQLPIVFEVR